MNLLENEAKIRIDNKKCILSSFIFFFFTTDFILYEDLSRIAYRVYVDKMYEINVIIDKTIQQSPYPTIAK